MLLNKINKLYDARIYYVDGKFYKEKYLANILEFYRNENSNDLTVIQYDIEKEDIVFLNFKNGKVIRSFLREDILMTYRSEEDEIKFAVETDR